MVADEEIFLDALLESDALYLSRDAGEQYIKALTARPLFYDYDSTVDSRLHPADAVRAVHETLHNFICIADSGNHRSFATHYWLSETPQGFYSANTICTMGWAIPASIGIYLARKTPCVVITGDGCMLMHGMEIQTAVRYNADIVYVVFNNGYYGATYFNNKNNIDEMSQLPTHDWVSFAQALGSTARRVNTLDELRRALHEFKPGFGPFLIDVHCSHLPETPALEYRTRMRQAGVL